MVTLKDIAEVVGVSESTVSRALSKTEKDNLVSAELRKRIKSVAKKLGYQPNLMARGLATRKSENVGLVIYRDEHLTHPVMTQILSGVAKALSKSNYSLLIYTLFRPGKVETNQELAGLFARRQVDGLVIVAHETNPLEILELLKQDYPFVLANFYLAEVATDNVRVNFHEVGREIIRYFIKLGHREIAVLPGPEKYGPVINRDTRDIVSGMLAAAAEGGIQLPPDRLLYTDYNEEEAYLATTNLLLKPERPTAIFAADDAMAIGVFKAAHQIGLEIPRDLSLLSGADTYVTQSAVIPISSIHIPYLEIGYQAAEILLQRLQGKKGEKEEIFLPIKIVERASCGKHIPQI